MPIIVSDTIAERGKADAKQHSDKQLDSIKKQLPDIIAEESIISTGGKGKTARVRIKELQIPVFRHGGGKGGQEGGIGQGKGKKGDVLGHGQQGKGKGNTAGDEPGVDYIETEMEMEKLLAIAFEDAGLPRLEERDVREIVVELGFRLRGTQNTGPQMLLNKRKTAKEGMRRFWHFLRALERETGKDDLTCYRALKQAGGVFEDALKLIHDNAVTDRSEEVVPFILLHAEDQRYHRIVEDTALQSRAVIFPIMDVSDSMGDEKKYLARLMLAWLVIFLRKLYTQVDIRFIIHHTQARLVDEQTFFSTRESGGTVSASAYSLANDLTDAEYPLSQWNVYVWHSSDGDDFNPDGALRELQKLFEKGINMFGYCDIRPGVGHLETSGLLKTFAHAFNLKQVKESNLLVHVGPDATPPFLGVQLRQKEDLLPAIKAFLKQDRWVQS